MRFIAAYTLLFTSLVQAAPGDHIVRFAFGCGVLLSPEHGRGAGEPKPAYELRNKRLIKHMLENARYEAKISSRVQKFKPDQVFEIKAHFEQELIGYISGLNRLLLEAERNKITPSSNYRGVLPSQAKNTAEFLAPYARLRIAELKEESKSEDNSMRSYLEGRIDALEEAMKTFKSSPPRKKVRIAWATPVDWSVDAE